MSMPTPLIVFIIFILLGVIILFMVNRNTVDDEDDDEDGDSVKNCSDDNVPLIDGGSKYNLFEEIKLFMARQTDYVMNGC